MRFALYVAGALLIAVIAFLDWGRRQRAKLDRLHASWESGQTRRRILAEAAARETARWPLYDGPLLAPHELEDPLRPLHDGRSGWDDGS